MKSKKRKSDFRYKVNESPRSISLRTENFFDISFTEGNDSPIDKFYTKIDSFNRLIGITSPNPLLMGGLLSNFNSLILLGYVSSVESYYREIIRSLINIDEIASQVCESKQLSFGAAISNSKNLLAEALIENTTFISKKNITEAIREFSGFKGTFPPDFENALTEFEVICHLRHCIVHRFGKLGSNNAIKFGLQNHKDIIEKPILLDQNKIFECMSICLNVVLVSNDFLFSFIMKRTSENNKWSWNYKKDKKAFVKYYDLFNSVSHPPVPTANTKDAYNELREYSKFNK